MTIEAEGDVYGVAEEKSVVRPKQNNMSSQVKWYVTSNYLLEYIMTRGVSPLQRYLNLVIPEPKPRDSWGEEDDVMLQPSTRSSASDADLPWISMVRIHPRKTSFELSIESPI